MRSPSNGAVEPARTLSSGCPSVGSSVAQITPPLGRSIAKRPETRALPGVLSPVAMSTRRFSCNAAGSDPSATGCSSPRVRMRNSRPSSLRQPASSQSANTGAGASVTTGTAGAPWLSPRGTGLGGVLAPAKPAVPADSRPIRVMSRSFILVFMVMSSAAIHAGRGVGVVINIHSHVLPCFRAESGHDCVKDGLRAPQAELHVVGVRATMVGAADDRDGTTTLLLQPRGDPVDQLAVLRTEGRAVGVEQHGTELHHFVDRDQRVAARLGHHLHAESAGDVGLQPLEQCVA